MSTAVVTDSWGRTLQVPSDDEADLLRYVTGLAQPSATFPGQRVQPLDLRDERQRRFFEARFGGAAELGRFFPGKQQVFDATAAWQAKNGVAIRADGVHRPAGALTGLPRFAAWQARLDSAQPTADSPAGSWEPALFLSAHGFYEGADGPSAGAAAVLTVPGGVVLQEMALELYVADTWQPVAATSSGPNTGAVLSLSAEGAMPSVARALTVLATAYYVAHGARFAIPVLVTADIAPPPPPSDQPASLSADAGSPSVDSSVESVHGISANQAVAGPSLSLAVGVPAAPKLALNVVDPVHKISPPAGPVRIGINRENIINDCDYYYAEPWVNGNVPQEIALALNGTAAAPQGTWFDARTPSNLNGSLVLVCRSGASAGGVMAFPASEVAAGVTVGSTLLTWTFDPAESSQTPFWQSSDVLDLYFTLNFAMNGAPGGVPNTSLTVTSDPSVQSTLSNVALVSQLQFVWGCVAADAPVRMANGTERRIDRVRIGHLVRADAGGRVLRVANVTRGREPGAMVQIETAAGRRVRVTDGHPVITPHGWTLARDLAPGDAVETEDGPDAVSSIRRIDGPTDIRNLVLAPVAPSVDASSNPSSDAYAGISIDASTDMPSQTSADSLDPARATFFAGGILVGDNRLQGHAAAECIRASDEASADWTDDEEWRHDVANFRRLAAGEPLVATTR